MNHSIQFINGYAIHLPNIGNRRFEFGPKLNVLYGPNGCGKTTILETLRSYNSIALAGWSRLPNPATIGAYNDGHFPHAFSGLHPARLTANVDWDGAPSFYNKGEIHLDTTWFFKNSAVMDDGFTTDVEQLKLLTDKPSTGQFRINRLMRMMDMFKSPPSIGDPDIQHMDRAARGGLDAARRYLSKLGPPGKIAALLDEPERALSIPAQFQLFEMLALLSESCQIIVATHSVAWMSLDPSMLNLIDVQQGYADETRQVLSKITS